MRISDWSSDVCSSDLHDGGGSLRDRAPPARRHEALAKPGCDAACCARPSRTALRRRTNDRRPEQIGRASCRERVCKYVLISVVALSLKQHNNTTITSHIYSTQ